MPLHPPLQLHHAHRLLKLHDSPLPADIAVERLAYEPPRARRACKQPVREPVVDAAVHAVERGVRRVHGHAGRGEAQEGALLCVRERDAAEGLEDERVVGDDGTGGRREGFVGDFGGEAVEDDV